MIIIYNYLSPGHDSGLNGQRASYVTQLTEQQQFLPAASAPIGLYKISPANVSRVVSHGLLVPQFLAIALKRIR